jgi:calcium/calmodulin-dependent protein kinase (CaM kinase) II
MPDPLSDELLQLNQRLLESIARRDWETYQSLCDPTLTAFEPEACGQLVQGLAFHQFYFQLGEAKGAQNTTMCAPHVRILGDTAVVSYVRLNQRQDSAGTPTTAASEETRVWQRQNGKWKHVHFHRSSLRT